MQEHILTDGSNLTPSDIITMAEELDKKGYITIHRTSGLGKSILREATTIKEK